MRNFATVGAIFSGCECVFEKSRATHDILNPMLGGCAAGAILASKGGKGKDRLYAMGLGCAGFAAFSLVIDRLFDPTL